MWGLPWGFLLLLPTSWLLFRRKGYTMIKPLGLSRRALLWYIFLLLAGCFFTVSAASFYLNLGGLLAMIFALRLLIRLTARERLRALLATALVCFFCFAFHTGQFWWLARLPVATGWLLPVLAGFLAALLGLSLAPAISGLIMGLLIGQAATLTRLNGGLLAVEFGSVAAINSLLLALFFCLLLLRLFQALDFAPSFGR